MSFEKINNHQENSNYVGNFDFEWLSAQDLADLDLRPKAVKDWLIKFKL